MHIYKYHHYEFSEKDTKDDFRQMMRYSVDDDDDDPEENKEDENNRHLDRNSEPWLWENEGKKQEDKWIGFIGDIKEKLEENKLKYITQKIHPSYPNDYVYPNSTPARLNKMYKQFKEENGVIEGNEDMFMHLHNKRMVVIVDRRHLSTDDVITDHIWMYEPPSHCRDIPDNAVSEWHISASKTCILPNQDYDEREAEMGKQAMIQPNGKLQRQLKERRERIKKYPNVTTDRNSMLFCFCFNLCLLCQK